MTDRDLLKMALKALETCKVYGEGNDEWVGFSEERVGAAVVALRERLAQQEQWEQLYPGIGKPCQRFNACERGADGYCARCHERMYP